MSYNRQLLFLLRLCRARRELPQMPDKTPRARWGDREREVSEVQHGLPRRGTGDTCV